MPTSQIKTGDNLLAATKDVREMSNALFQFMYSQWDDKDYLDIASNPGDYVIALSDLINEQFDVIGYTTKRNQIGEIYFKRVDKLKHPGAEGQAGIETQRQNTQIIAFYFVRIFQILGALLLVVKDISFPIVKPVNDTITGRAIIDQTLPRFRPLQAGGSLFPSDIPLGPYEFLRYYLRDITGQNDLISKYAKEYGYTIDPNTTFMIKDSANLFFKYKVQSTNQGRVNNRAEFIAIVMRQQRNTPISMPQEVNISNINSRSPPQLIAPVRFSSAATQLDQYPMSLSIDLKIGQKTPQTATVNRTDTSVTKDSYTNGAEYYFNTGTYVDLFMSLYANNPKTQFVKVLEQLVVQAIRTSSGDKTFSLYNIKSQENISAGPKTIVRGRLDDNNMIARPTIDEIYRVLLQTEKNELKSNDKRHNPHCISRALQLLDSNSIQESTPLNAKTRVCKVAVADKAGPINLAMYVPTKSLAQLYGKVNPIDFKNSEFILRAFVGKQATKNPLSTSQLSDKGQDGESKALSNAIDRVAAAFEFVSQTPIKGFDEVVVSRPAECKGRTDILNVEDKDVALQLQSSARQLMTYHVNHTIEIAKFLKTIFNIAQRPDGSWNVEGPKTEIMFAGFIVLDQLTDQARELLVDYYSGCETIYQKGLKTWKTFEGAPANGVPANGVPANGVPLIQNNKPLINSANRSR